MNVNWELVVQVVCIWILVAMFAAMGISLWRSSHRD